MKAEIIATGTEILLGEIVDTNTSFLAAELATLGIDIHFTSSVGDNFHRMSEALRQAMQRSDIIITTGGLGPTQGDITRNVIASVLGQTLYIDQNLKQDLIDYFSRMGVAMPENNLRQATLISAARAIPNPNGTAPGWWVENDNKIIISLPGPPREMQAMWQNHVRPHLQQKSGAITVSRILKTWGLSESRIDEILTPYLSSSNPTLAIYARQDGIILRITAKSENEAAANKIIETLEAEIRKLLGNHIWGTGEDAIAEVVLKLLAEHGLTLAVGEANTGGFLTGALAAGNSPFFRGGLILQGQEAKQALGLEPGLAMQAAGKLTAAAMATLAMEKLNADAAIGLDIDTGHPGATETSPRKVFIAINIGDGKHNSEYEYNWRPVQAVVRASLQALFMMRETLLSMK